MKRCHICGKRIPLGDEHEVALRNHLYLTACFRCWFLWPDDHKRTPLYKLMLETAP